MQDNKKQFRTYGSQMKNNWQTKKLGEIYDVRDGTHDSPKYTKDGFALVTSKNLKNDTLNYEKINYISEQDYISINKRSKVDVGDVLFAMIGTIGNPIVIRDVPNFAIKNVALFKVPQEQDSKFLKYYLDSGFVIDKMVKDAKGTTQKFVGLGYLRNFPILLPPLHEQCRIVKILDEVFADVAKTKESTEKNLQNSKELFESYLQSIFSNPGKDWKEVKFDEIVGSNVIGIVKNTKEQSDDKKYKYVKMNNITKVNGFDFSKYSRVNATLPEVEKYNLIKGDFLFNTRNSYELVGKTCIFEGDDEKNILFNNNIMRVRFIKKVSSHFINYAFSSKIVINKIKHFKSGTTNVSAIYYKDLKNLILLIPLLSEQKSIVAKLDALSAETKKLEGIYKQKLTDLEEFKKSILQKAFNGEL